MPLNLRQAASTLIDAGYTDDEIRGVLDTIKQEASTLIDEGLTDEQIEKRLGASKFKTKDGADIQLFGATTKEPSAAPEPQVSMTKTAVPRPQTFMGHLGGELSSAAGSIGSGIKRMVSGETVGGPGGQGILPSLSLPSVGNVAMGVGEAAMGSLQGVYSGQTAMARTLADVTGGKLTEALAPKFGQIMGGEKGAALAALIGTTMGTPVEFVASGGLAMAKALPAVKGAIEGASGVIGKALNMTTAPKLVADAAQWATKVAARHAPGSVDAQIAMGIDNVQQTLDRLKAAAEARVAIAKARFQPLAGEDIAVPQGAETVKNLLGQLRSLGLKSENDPGLNAVETLNKLITQKAGLLKASTLDEQLSNIGELTKSMVAKGENVHPGYSALFRAFASDAENVYPVVRTVRSGGREGSVAPIPGGDGLLGFSYPSIGVETKKPFFPSDAGPAFRFKDEEIKRLKGVEAVEGVFEKLKRIKRGKDADNVDVNANQILTWMREETNKKLGKQLNPEDRADLEAVMTGLAELPAASTGKGIKYGAGMGLAATGAASAAAWLAGGGPTAMAVSSSITLTMLALSQRLLPTKVGRKALRSVLESGPIDQSKLDMLGTLANAIGEGENVRAEIRDMLKTPQSSLEEKINAAQALK